MQATAALRLLVRLLASRSTHRQHMSSALARFLTSSVACRRKWARRRQASSLLAMRIVAHILLARRFWRSRIWLRSRLASCGRPSPAWARPVPGPEPAGVWLSAKGWTGQGAARVARPHRR
jgi:hypothetical protein